MAYFFVPFIIILVGLLVIYRWLMNRQLSGQIIHNTREKLSQLIAVGNWEEAEKELNVLLKHSPHHSKTTLLQSQVLRGTRQFSKACTIIEECLKKNPHDLCLLQERAKVLLDLGKPQLALESLKSCTPIIRTEDEILDLARALYQNSLVDEAWRQLQDFIMRTTNGRLLALAGDCRFQRQRYQEALILYQRAQDNSWSNLQILLRIGHCYRRLDKWFKAKQAFAQILQHDESDISAVIGFGECLENEGEYHKALSLYQAPAIWDQGSPYILRQAGICAAHNGQYSYAQLYLQEALNKGISSPQALAFLGYSLEHQKLWRQAEKVYVQLAEEYPSHPAGYLGLAWLYGVGLTSSLDAETGLSVAYRAVDVYSDPVSWELLSACEARAGNFDKAHTIQENLFSQTEDKTTRQRLQQAMRTLRKKRPLDHKHVRRVRVA
ncbi:MAG: tetratricopeptide repeat protein [Chlamydiota bacterium]